MEQLGIDSINKATEKKQELLKQPFKYAIYASMAGVVCSLGMALAYTLGGEANANSYMTGITRLLTGASFAFALTLIMFAGTELFTGNVIVVAVSTLDKKISVKKALSILGASYVANILGAAITGWIFYKTGLIKTDTSTFMESAVSNKLLLSGSQALFRGMLCNICICLGVWACAKMKSESGKAIIIFWVILAFVGTGYEHSIANAGLFTMVALASQQIDTISVMHNMLWVTLGNTIGGVVIAWIYWYTGRELKD